ESFYTSILDLDVDGKKEPVVLRDLQRHPFKLAILHLDLQRINAAEKIIMKIPFHFVGAEMSPGVKVSGGLVSHPMTDVEVCCLPKDLPEFIEVDLSKLAINQIVHLSDLKMPKDVEIVPLAHDDNKPVATIYAHRAATEESTAAPEAAEVPVAGEDKDKADAEAEAKK
ncbi:MAG: 50S ribosomal protein L25/general stress protein Ctc, partial [Thiotrichaceae bacterium]|nr:50S ribosomal protein L25/general stress protein Ctc [Thiotrichaceae bacterium]